MEHRLAERRSVCLVVMLHYRPLGLVRGRILNWGEGGLFIDTGALRLPRNALVEVAVAPVDTDARRSLRGEPQRAQCLVLHTQDHGAGLMFINTETRAYEQLMRRLEPAALDRAAAASVRYAAEVPRLGYTA